MFGDRGFENQLQVRQNRRNNRRPQKETQSTAHQGISRPSSRPVTNNNALSSAIQDALPKDAECTVEEAQSLVLQVVKEAQDEEQMYTILMSIFGSDKSEEVINILSLCLQSGESAAPPQQRKRTVKRVAVDPDPQTEPVPTVGKAQLDDDGIVTYTVAQLPALPQGTVRMTTPDAEIYEVPATPPSAQAKSQFRIPISDLPQWAQPAFSSAGVQSFNPIQSSVFVPAFIESSNILVCAPTGAGKTNIAMLVILRAIQVALSSSGLLGTVEQAWENTQNGESIELPRLLPQNMKIVYLTPMKALATEITGQLSSRLKALKMGITVREWTGEQQLTPTEVERTHVFVCTPEKWDIVTRKAGPDHPLSAVSCVIIDEIHLLASDRGPVLEGIVARHKKQEITEQRRIRLVGLSATLPNWLDVAQFIDCSRDQAFFFDNSWRPVPLRTTLVGTLRIKAQGKEEQKAETQPASEESEGWIVEAPESSDANALREGRRGGRKKGGKRGPSEKSDRARPPAPTPLSLEAQQLDRLTHQFVLEELQTQRQVLIFVQSRKGTGDVARQLASDLQRNGEEHLLFPGHIDASHMRKKYAQMSDGQLASLMLQSAIGYHHAGLVRRDRLVVEEAFRSGALRVLVSTSTLAWGVNLPAATVICRGTKYYNPDKSQWCDLDILDLLQMFGRAGRPQFSEEGRGILITEQKSLPYYVTRLFGSQAIESSLHQEPYLSAALNAEIVRGTIASLEDAKQWIHQTFLAVRMSRHPDHYGFRSFGKDSHVYTQDEMEERICLEGIRELLQYHAVRYDPQTHAVNPTEIGRVACHYYIRPETAHMFTEQCPSVTRFVDILKLLVQSEEFSHVLCREDEIHELKTLQNKTSFSGDPDHGFSVAPLMPSAFESFSEHGKLMILVQCLISRQIPALASLQADMLMVEDSALRIARAALHSAVESNASQAIRVASDLSTALETRCWPSVSPLVGMVHFGSDGDLNMPLLQRLRQRAPALSSDIVGLSECIPSDLDALLSLRGSGATIKRAINSLPRLVIEPQVRPICEGVIEVTVAVSLPEDYRIPPSFRTRTLDYWVLIEDAGGITYHTEFLSFSAGIRPKDGEEPRAAVLDHEFKATIELPLLKNGNYMEMMVSAFPDGWPGQRSLEQQVALGVSQLVWPHVEKATTELLRLPPLSVHALHCSAFERCLQFSYFNAIQTQVFHAAYHCDMNLLVGAATGSGKTVVAELALFRLLATRPGMKCVYLCPMKALARERINDWRRRLAPTLGLKVIELSGESDPGSLLLGEADIICCSAEKWDACTRGWTPGMETTRRYIAAVGLIIMDEVHLIGMDRGPVIESIIARHTQLLQDSEVEEHTARIVALTSPLSDSSSLAAVLHVPSAGVYNFPHAARPVQLDMHIAGFPERAFCPRMESMNSTVYNSIVSYASDVNKSALVFVPSRRQTRLTGLNLALRGINENVSFEGREVTSALPHEMHGLSLCEIAAQFCSDADTAHCLEHGIGLHHAGLSIEDRRLVELLFLARRIRVIVATATLAVGLNLPASLVIVKGCKFFDAKKGGYVDYSLTELLQMVGRAGRPQFDTQGTAVVLCHTSMKEYYQRFLQTPFPLESHLTRVPDTLENQLNAEIALGGLRSLSDALNWARRTFWYQRLRTNPCYYGLPGTAQDAEIECFVVDRLNRALDTLCLAGSVHDLGALTLTEEQIPTLGQDKAPIADNRFVASRENHLFEPTLIGKLVAQYYLSYRTGRRILERVREDITVSQMLAFLPGCFEFAEVPVRHCEDVTNEQIESQLRLAIPYELGTSCSPHFKTHLLLQLQLNGVLAGRTPLPDDEQQEIEVVSDYLLDLASVMAQAPRILAAVSAYAVAMGWAQPVLAATRLSAALTSGIWPDYDPREVCFKCPDRALLQHLAHSEPRSAMLWSLPGCAVEARRVLAGKSNAMSHEVAAAFARWPHVRFIVFQRGESIELELTVVQSPEGPPVLAESLPPRPIAWVLLIESNNQIYYCNQVRMESGKRQWHIPVTADLPTHLSFHLSSLLYCGYEWCRKLEVKH